jgi:phosphoglycolate phosphatase
MPQHSPNRESPNRQIPPGLIVFDLDGTLVDSRRDLADAANAVLAEHGAPPQSETAIGGMVGDGARALVERAFEAAGLGSPPAAALARFLDIYDARLLEHTRPYPGIPDVLTQLGRVARLAVLTNKPLGAARRVLEGLSLAGYFGDVLGGDGPDPRKPDAAGFLRLAETAGVAPSKAWLVGDSRVDLQTARNAGARVCLVRYGFGFDAALGLEIDGHDRIVDRPEDLVALRD